MAISQVFLKFAGIHAAVQFDIVHDFVKNYWLWGGLMLSGFGLCFWMITLHKMPLSSAYPWTALIYVLTPIASVIFFDDVLSFNYVLGMISIVVGVFLTTGGVATQ
ncbi:MAG: SMR family transporter [Motiliproteus sp.]